MISVQIVCRDFRLTPSIRAEIKEYASKLEGLYPRIVGCEVTLSSPHRRKRKGKIYHVAIRISLPGPDIFVGREPEEDQSHEDLRIAIHDAFRAAERCLEDQVHERRRFVKAHEESPRGRVARIFPDMDFGFLEATDGQEVYFHRNSVKGLTLDRMKPGMPVHFQIEQGDNGPQAVFVRAVRRAKRLSREAA